MTQFQIADKNLIEIEGILFSENNCDRFISYPDHHNLLMEIEDSSFWFKHRNACISSVVKKFTPNETVFDVGGGNGYVSKCLVSEGNDVVLIEPSIEGARNAKRRGINKVICSTLQDSGFSQGEVPNVGIFDVLEHIEKDDEFLTYLHSMIKSGGYLYITVPAYQMLWSHEDEIAGHYRRYSLRRLFKVVRQAGFKVKFKSYMFFFLPIPVFLFRTIPRIFGITKSGDTARYEHNPKLLSKIANALLLIESKLIHYGLVRFGGSCIIAAQKDK